MCLVAFARTPSYSALEKMDRPPDRPTWAYVVICDDCSHRCGWCYGGFNHDLSHRMPLDDFERLLTTLEAVGIRQVTLAGGEPTEHPAFRDFVRRTDAAGFLIHVASHGEHIDADLAAFMARHRVRQVQLNFQGRRFHDRIHGVAGSYAKQRAAVGHLQAAGIEVTTTTTVGQYNLAAVPAIFAEAAALGVDRLRVWEATGHGNPFRKDVEAKEIFAACRSAAAALGYTHTLSYDPEYEGDVTVPCLQLSNLFMYITSRGALRYCGAVVGGSELDIIDCLTAPPERILDAYLAFNARVRSGRRPWCAARLGMAPDAGAADDGAAAADEVAPAHAIDVSGAAAPAGVDRRAPITLFG